MSCELWNEVRCLELLCHFWLQRRRSTSARTILTSAAVRASHTCWILVVFRFISFGAVINYVNNMSDHIFLPLCTAKLEGGEEKLWGMICLNAWNTSSGLSPKAKIRSLLWILFSAGDFKLFLGSSELNSLVQSISASGIFIHLCSRMLFFLANTNRWFSEALWAGSILHNGVEELKCVKNRQLTS